MPFDPALPLPDSDIESAVLRAQFTALKALSDALSAQAAALAARVAALEAALPGLVTPGQLAAAIADTSLNVISYPAFTGSFSDPPTASELWDFQGWVDGLRTSLGRAV